MIESGALSPCPGLELGQNGCGAEARASRRRSAPPQHEDGGRLASGYPSRSSTLPAPHAEEPSAGRRLEARSESSQADRLADLAVAALIAEATLTPKPGLVDARGAGAHADVELGDFLASAEALRATFAALARTAAGRRPSQMLREKLAAIGRDGEAAMLAATGRANTHRGAIFALGLIVAAAAIEGDSASAVDICATAGAIARLPDRYAPATELNGARACRVYGVSGARGEAAAGFPHALKALAGLREARARGADETAARLDALLAVMASLDDTCLLHRGGFLALRVARLGARAALTAGGASTGAGMAALIALDRRLLAMNASPGGAADMLAAALLLDALTRRQEEPRHGPARPDHPRFTSGSTLKVGPPVKPEDDGEVRAPRSEDDPGSAHCIVRNDAATREA